MDEIPARGARLAREPVTRYRRNHHVEGVLGGSAERRGVGQRADQVEHLDDRARPAVGDDQRQSALVARLDVDEVDVEPVDLRHELRQRVQPFLDSREVVAVAPIAGELLHRLQLHTLRRILHGLLLGPTCGLDALKQVSDLRWGKANSNGRTAVVLVG